MGNRNRQRNCRSRKPRFLRFEPLELRLQFAVDYPIWEADFFRLPGSEFLAPSEPVSAWSVYEFGAPAALDLITIYELNTAHDSVQQFGVSAPYSPLTFDSVNPVFDHLGGVIANNLDTNELSGEAWLLGNVAHSFVSDASTPNMDFADSIFLTDLEQPFLRTIQQLFEIDELDWIGVAVPLQDQFVSFGLTSFEPLIFPTSLVRHGPDIDALLAAAEAFPTVDQDDNIQGFAINESPESLSHNRSSSFDFGLTSPYQGVGELLNSKFHVSSPDLQSREIVGQVAGRSIITKSSHEVYHTENTLGIQPFVELELDAQLPVDNSTHRNSRALHSRASANVAMVTPGHVSSKSANAVLAMNMLPLGMLPIGNEPLNSPTSSSRDYAGNQNFIVQTALICESLNPVVVRHENGGGKGNNDKPLASKEFDRASPIRTLEILAAGFVLFVAQTRFRLPKPLRCYWEKCVARFSRPLDGC